MDKKVKYRFFGARCRRDDLMKMKWLKMMMMMTATPQVLLEYLPGALAGTSTWAGLACSLSNDVEGENESRNGGRPPGGCAPNDAMSASPVMMLDLWSSWIY